MIRVLIADDQALVRAGFRVLLDAERRYRGRRRGRRRRRRLAWPGALHPDIVLMDIRMPGTDGLAATRAIVADPRLADVRVIILTTFELDEYVFEAIRNGASGFLVKDTDPAELLRGVRAVAQGDALLSPSVTRRIIEEFAARIGPPHHEARLSDLTAREREILAVVAEGLSNDEIAERLFISPTTAKTHISRVMHKLGVRDRAQLVVIAYETGLVRPGWGR